MKLRFGFVSNSSSSSFCINLNHLNAEQLWKILYHRDTAKELEIEYAECNNWVVEVTHEGYVKGYTDMDNLRMEDLFEKLGVPMDKVVWDKDEN